MTKTRIIVALAFVLVALVTQAVMIHAAVVVEVTLGDKLDEPRGYCLDVVGSQHRAQPSRGIQAHTCYSYQGKIAVDQGFSRDRLQAGQFHLPQFDVCITLKQSRRGSPLMLATCDDSAAQRFQLKPTGEIVSTMDSTLCLTVADGVSMLGGGGNPVHRIRRLALERCDEKLGTYQRWRLRDRTD